MKLTKASSGGECGFGVGSDGIGDWAGDIAFPRIQGADCVGRIAAVGDGVDPARIGERVVCAPYIYDPGDPDWLENAGFLGAEYEGAVRDDLIRRLLALRDPETGAAIVPFAARREDVASGPALEELPDVMIDLGDAPYEAVREEYDVDSFLRRDEWADGSHRRDGTWIAAGPGIVGPVADGGDGPALDVTDVAPLVLRLLGCPAPPLDGSVPEELLRAAEAEAS